MIQSYFQKVWMILSHPTQFFRQLPPEEDISVSLTFALITHWLGVVIAFLWQNIIGSTTRTFLSQLTQWRGHLPDQFGPTLETFSDSSFRERVLDWIFGAGAVLIDPFLTLISILFTSSLVFVGARILVPQRRPEAPNIEVSFRSAVKVVSYGMTPILLTAVPLLGGMISSLYSVIVTIIGARETYQISSGRAVVIAFFPRILFLGAVLGGIALIGFALIQLFSFAF